VTLCSRRRKNERLAVGRAVCDARRADPRRLRALAVSMDPRLARARCPQFAVERAREDLAPPRPRRRARRCASPCPRAARRLGKERAMQTSAAAQRFRSTCPKTLAFRRRDYTVRASAPGCSDDTPRIAIIADRRPLRRRRARPEPRAVSLAADPLLRRERPRRHRHITPGCWPPAFSEALRQPVVVENRRRGIVAARQTVAEERARRLPSSRRRRQVAIVQSMVKDLAFDPRRRPRSGRAGGVIPERARRRPGTPAKTARRIDRARTTQSGQAQLLLHGRRHFVHLSAELLKYYAGSTSSTSRIAASRRRDRALAATST